MNKFLIMALFLASGVSVSARDSLGTKCTKNGECVDRMIKYLSEESDKIGKMIDALVNTQPNEVIQTVAGKNLLTFDVLPEAVRIDYIRSDEADYVNLRPEVKTDIENAIKNSKASLDKAKADLEKAKADLKAADAKAAADKAAADAKEKASKEKAQAQYKLDIDALKAQMAADKAAFDAEIANAEKKCKELMKKSNCKLKK
jgi:hypothetical protein